MGWKTVKEHYRIDRHQVAINPEWDEFERQPTGDQLLCIGTSLCHDIISINLRTWKFKRAMSGSLHDLQRVWDAMHFDLRLLAELVAQPDTFQESIPVFTYRDGEILELRCEALGYPNVTHDGQMMYNNRFFANRADALAAGLRSAEARLENSQSWVREVEDRYAKAKRQLASAEADLAKLKADPMFHVKQTQRTPS